MECRLCFCFQAKITVQEQPKYARRNAHMYYASKCRQNKAIIFDEMHHFCDGMHISADKLHISTFVTYLHFSCKKQHFVAVFCISSRNKCIPSEFIAIFLQTCYNIFAKSNRKQIPNAPANKFYFIIMRRFFMKHFGLKRIGKKLIALSMAAVASVTIMLAAAPAASADSATVYKPTDSVIDLPAPIYNWRNCNKVLKFKVKKANGGTGTVGDAMRLIDKSDCYRTNFICYKFGSGVTSIGNGGTMSPIQNSGGWYECSIPVKQLNPFTYPTNANEYLPSHQTKLQTLVKLENRGFYYKDIEIIETVDPDRDVSRFYTNNISVNVWNKDDMNTTPAPAGRDSVRY